MTAVKNTKPMDQISEAATSGAAGIVDISSCQGMKLRSDRAATYFFGEFAMTNFELGLLDLLEVSHG